MEHDPHCGCASRARFCMCVSSTLWNRVWSTFQILDVYLEHDLLVRPDTLWMCIQSTFHILNERLERALGVRLEHIPHSGCVSRVHSKFWALDVRLEHALGLRLEYTPHSGCVSRA